MAYIKKEFNSEPVYNKEFLKTKIKSHGDEVKDYYDKAIQKQICFIFSSLGLTLVQVIAYITTHVVRCY